MPNRTIVFIDIPPDVLPSKTPSDALRALVAVALNEKLPLQFIETSGMLRKSAFIPPAIDVHVELIAKKHGWSYPDAFAAMCVAALSELIQKRNAMVQVRADVQIPFNTRPGQDIFYQSIVASIQKNRVCLGEASTGIGKSRALVAAAIDAAQSGKRPVVISAPTLAILGGSLWKEYEELYKTGVGVTLKVRFFPGASEFVDHERLNDYLNEAVYVGETVDAGVKAWVDAGGPVRNQTPLIVAMKRAGKDLRWLMSDLREIATELDPTEFAFKKTPNCNKDVSILVDEIRQDAITADIIFCTHAMLARGMQGGWEWFPQPSVLLIDEAHQFEGIVASATSDSLSLFAFRHSIRVLRKTENLGKSSAIGKLESMIGELILSTKSMDDGKTNVRLNNGTASNDAFMNALRETAACLKSKTLAKVPRIKEARSTISMALESIAGTVNAFGLLQYSPDRRFPSFLVGKRSIASLLGALWRDASGGVVLASATLSTPDEFGNTKFDYIAGLLALPLSRLDTPNPVIAPWVTSIPVLHLPNNPGIISRPLRANRTDELEMAWLESLSEQISCVAEAAKGGTLVLMTSYAQVNGLKTFLTEMGLGERLVVQNPDEKFAASEARFRALHQEKMRPILLGLGVAWTGVDLTDKAVPESEDYLLTDLIIGCLPVGLNRSSTMAARVETQGLNPIIKEALMILRQGIGRPVRSENAKEKHIWIMDGRLWTEWPGMAPLQKSARRVLEKYSKQEMF